MPGILEIFISFFKVGAFTIGGGFAMLPMIQNVVVKEKDWMTDEEFLDSISLTNSLPGPVSINSSTFIGYRIRGFIGALVACLGAMTPSVIIILIVANFFTHIMDREIIQYVFEGVRPAVVALILYASITLSKAIDIKKELNWLIIILGFIAITVFDIHPVIVILTAALFGIYLRSGLIDFLKAKRGK